MCRDWIAVDRPGIAYSRVPLDRMAAERDTRGFAQRMVDLPAARVLPMADGTVLVDEMGQPVWFGTSAVGAQAIESLVFLGRNDGEPRFAINARALSETAALPFGTRFVSIRSLAHRLSHDELALLGYAKGLLHWHAHQRHCGGCGGATESVSAGHQRRCVECGISLFPRIEPAVIVLVEDDAVERRCLLVRHTADGTYSTLAGFVEVGEGLEEAVRREVAEEAGVTIDALRFVGSQAWPFPASLMVAFRARAAAGPTTPDGIEVLEARWFTRKDVRALFRTPDAAESAGSALTPDSLERALIEGWLEEGDAEN